MDADEGIEALRLREAPLHMRPFVLRACIVNFQTSLVDIERLPGIVARLRRVLDATMRPEALHS
jgi:hypothetical protein